MDKQNWFQHWCFFNRWCLLIWGAGPPVFKFHFWGWGGGGWLITGCWLILTWHYQPSNTCDTSTDLPWQVVMVRTTSHPGNPQFTQTRAYWGLWRRGCVHEFCHLASSARGSVSSMAHQLQGSLVKPWWKLRWRRFMRETYRWTVKWFQNTTVVLHWITDDCGCFIAAPGCSDKLILFRLEMNILSIDSLCKIQ